MRSRSVHNWKIVDIFKKYVRYEISKIKKENIMSRVFLYIGNDECYYDKDDLENCGEADICTVDGGENCATIYEDGEIEIYQ